MSKKRNEIKFGSFAELKSVIDGERVESCRICGAKIQFVPDRLKAGMYIPINYDDKTLHFNSCKNNSIT